MLPSNEVTDKKKILHDLKEIEELSINVECNVEIQERIANWKNQVATCGQNRSVNICKEIEENQMEL